jgi:hypothetical protein
MEKPAEIPLSLTKKTAPAGSLELLQFLRSRGHQLACDPRTATDLISSLEHAGLQLSDMRSWDNANADFALEHCLRALHGQRGVRLVQIAPIPLPPLPVPVGDEALRTAVAASLDGTSASKPVIERTFTLPSLPEVPSFSGPVETPKIAAPALFYDGPTEPKFPATAQVYRPSNRPTPQPTPTLARPYTMSEAEIRGTARRGFAAATTLAGLMGWGIYNELEHPAVGSLPDQNPYHVIATPEEVAPAPVAAPVAPAETTPVYTAVVAAFEGDPEADLKIPATTNALVHDYYVGDGIGHGWQDVKALHAWSDSPEALTRLEWHMDQWGANRGGYEAVILSGERADCRATTIDELLVCVETDPAIRAVADGKEVARKVAEMVTAMKDAKIMPDQGAVLEMHEKMTDDLPAMVKEINREVEAGMLKAPATFHYPVAAEQSGEMGALYDAPDPMNLLHQEETVEMADVSEFLEEEDVPDVTDSLEDMDATDVVEPLHLQAASTAVEQAPAHTGLSGLATWMENDQTHLNKKARGKNRELLPAFCAGVAADVREMGIRFEGFSPSGREVALFQLKTKFLTRLNVLHGRPKAKYLAQLTRGFTESLAAMLPDQERGKDLMTLPEGIFRA